jgi:hypothetical protein
LSINTTSAHDIAPHGSAGGGHIDGVNTFSNPPNAFPRSQYCPYPYLKVQNPCGCVSEELHQTHWSFHVQPAHVLYILQTWLISIWHDGASPSAPRSLCVTLDLTKPHELFEGAKHSFKNRDKISQHSNMIPDKHQMEEKDHFLTLR